MSKCLAYYARILQSVKKKDMVLSLSLSVFFFKAENETPSSHRSGTHSAWMKYEVLPQHEQRVSDTSCQPAAHVWGQNNLIVTANDESNLKQYVPW